MEKQPTTSKPGALHAKASPKKSKFNEHFDRSFSFTAMKGKQGKQKKKSQLHS